MKNFLLENKYLDADTKLLNPYALDIEPSDGDHAIVTGFVHASEKGIDIDKRQISGMCSTESIDRYEEIIEASAFTPWLAGFMGNPQFLAGHKMVGFDSAEPTNIGQWIDLQVERGIGLRGTAQFLEAGDALADRYWTRYQQRAMRAFSVGVIVHEWAMREFELQNGVTKRIRVLTNCELLEISAVSVPANRQALVRAAGLAAENPQRSADEMDIQKLKQLILAELKGELVAQTVKEIMKQLDAEPGKPMWRALERIVESAQLLSGDHLGCSHDAHDSPGKENKKDKGHPFTDYFGN